MKRLFTNVEMLYKLAKHGCGLHVSYDKETDTMVIHESKETLRNIINTLKEKIKVQDG